MLSTEPVTVAVPATSANLGPGFDALGLALALEDEVTAGPPAAASGSRSPARAPARCHRRESHLIVATMLRTFAASGRPATARAAS